MCQQVVHSGVQIHTVSEPSGFHVTRESSFTAQSLLCVTLTVLLAVSATHLSSEAPRKRRSARRNDEPQHTCPHSKYMLYRHIKQEGKSNTIPRLHHTHSLVFTGTICPPSAVPLHTPARRLRSSRRSPSRASREDSGAQAVPRRRPRAWR